MKLIIKTLTLILLTTLNSIGQSNTINKKVDHYKTHKFDVAIFPKEYQDLIAGECFTPTRQEIIIAEIKLEKDLEKLNNGLSNQSSSPIIHKNLKKYRRQYFGYIDDNGDRILLINAFWFTNMEYQDGWLAGRIVVLDGGSYFWTVKFNLDNGKLFDLRVNGYA